MTLKKLQIIVLGCALSATANAGRMGDDYWERGDTAYVVTVTGGPAWMQAGKTQTIFLQSDLFKTYTANRSKEAIGSGELFLGMQKILNSKLQGQLGLAIEGTSAATLDGNIYEDANPDFNNYVYTYKVQHMHVAVKTKLLADVNLGYDAIPYLCASAGVGRNHASSFSITPKIVQEVPAPFFQNTSTTGFSFTLGAGLQLPFSSNWLAGIGYEFIGWGKSQLARAPGQTMHTGLTVNNITSQHFQLSLTYLA